MSPRETRLVEFLEARLDSLLTRPAAWGTGHSVEDQLLQLLEIRRYLLDPSTSVNDTYRLMQDYTRFVSATLADATSEPLAIQLEARGRSEELTSLLRTFVDQELAANRLRRGLWGGDSIDFSHVGPA